MFVLACCMGTGTGGTNGFVRPVLTCCSLRSGSVEGAKPGGTGAIKGAGTAAGEAGAAAGAEAIGVPGAAPGAGVAAFGEVVAGGELLSPPQAASVATKIPMDSFNNI